MLQGTGWRASRLFRKWLQSTSDSQIGSRAWLGPRLLALSLVHQWILLGYRTIWSKPGSGFTLSKRGCKRQTLSWLLFVIMPLKCRTWYSGVLVCHLSWRRWPQFRRWSRARSMPWLPIESVGGTRAALVVTLSHFSELEVDLDLLGSGQNNDLSEKHVDTLWNQVRSAVESHTVGIPSATAHTSPDDRVLRK
jgi:hypothetical protein